MSEPEKNKVAGRNPAADIQRATLEMIEDLFNKAPVGYHSLDSEGLFVNINDTELSWLGYSREEVVGKMNLKNILTPSSLKTFHATFPVFKKRGYTHDLEMEFIRRDGSILPVLVSATAVRDKDGAYIMSRSTCYDITARRQAEEKTKKLNRLYEVLHSVNQVMIRAVDVRSLFYGICRVAVDEGLFLMAWVGLADEASHTVKPVAYSGCDDGYLDSVMIKYDDSPEGAGPTGSAVRTGTHYINNDTENDPLMQPWRDEALSRGYRSSAAFPLMSGERVFGALTLYASVPHFFDDDEVRLLDSLAADITFTLLSMDLGEKLRSLVEQSRNGYFIFQDNHAAYMNDGLAEMLGFSRGEIEGTGVLEHIHPDDRDEVARRMGEALAGTDPSSHRWECRVIARDGRTVWGDVSYFSTDYHGRPAVAGSVFDITEKKLAEAERETTVEFLQLVNSCSKTDGLLHAAADFLYRKFGFDAVAVRLKKGDDFPYHEVRGFPDEFVKSESSLCGHYPSGEVIRDTEGKAVLECMCGSIVTGRVDLSKPFFSKGGSFWTNGMTQIAGEAATVSQPRIRGRCGAEGYESVALVPLYVGEERLGALQFNDRRSGLLTPGNVAFMEGLAGHLSSALAKIRAEEAVRESEEKFRAIINNTTDAILLLDHTSSSVIAANPAACLMFGYTHEEFMRLAKLDVVDTSDPAFASFVKKRDRAGTARGEINLIRKDGSSFPAEVSSTLFYDRDGNARVTNIIRDISGRKALDRQKADFLAMVTHDLKSPLTSVLGYAELLAEHVDDRGGPMVEAIRHGGEKILGIVDDFMTISRMEAGNLDLRKDPVDVRLLLYGIEEAFRPLAEKKGLYFRCEAGDGLPEITVDKKHFERVLDNLLQNSLNYTPEGGKIELTAERSGDGVEFSVEDTGAGIPAGEQALVFDKYYRSPRNSGIKGTGLGLAIVRAITEAHGGRVELTSAPGSGSTFRLYIPAGGHE